ncbi:citrate synthase [Sulfobacillus harzensis]|uniref:Citrate synthase n=1 Tax=Sulfobacillus harzensis TaxID=2729629 RepID=A0A7Y0L660_9FIRM|nr:citrate synthase [Sulfobacillus harzensis]NMP24012.1 citrate synthase [Sulfobacillus harzensis]
MPEQGFKAGLEDVVANTSEICFIDGHEGRLVYRGYNVADLAETTSFEEVVYLLWNGDLPNQAQLAQLKDEIKKSAPLAKPVHEFLRSLPHDTHPMDALRTAVSLAGIYDPDGNAMTPEANHRKAVRLVAQVPTIVAAFDRLRHGKSPVDPDPSLSLAENFLYMLHGEKPKELHAKVFNTALILHADHELNASTFSARVTAGTLSDMYSAITSAIGTLKGPLHGGANEQVMYMLQKIGSVENAKPWVEAALARKEKIMGFGHRVYRTEDPRAIILRRLSKDVGEDAHDLKWYNMLNEVREVIMGSKKLYPNVDLYSGSVYFQMGIPTDIFTPVFAISRVSGWTAHVLEQYQNNRLIRPRAEYTGATHRDFVPLEKR